MLSLIRLKGLSVTSPVTGEKSEILRKEVLLNFEKSATIYIFWLLFMRFCRMEAVGSWESVMPCSMDKERQDINTLSK